ncbi:tetratricopeptide repeat protein [Geobacillus subterraneus]|uniref:tetratricopeptide repeat protein n=1 Tax=Geobacillus subterraneus TaxID=129338 RepID=UPI0017C37FD7
MSRPDPKQAKLYLQKALRYNPFHALAHYRLAHIYYGENEYAKAVHHFDCALSERADGG